MDHVEIYFKGLEYAWNSSKELAGLTTVILGVTIGLRKDVFAKNAGRTRFFLVAAWLCYLVSLVFALFVYNCITGEIEAHVKGTDLTEFTPGIDRSWGIQLVSFGLGTTFVVIESVVVSWFRLGKDRGNVEPG